MQNLVDKIEYFDEEDQILTELPYVPDLCEPPLESDVVVRYYLLMKSSLLKEIKVSKIAEGTSETDERDR